MAHGGWRDVWRRVRRAMPWVALLAVVAGGAAYLAGARGEGPAPPSALKPLYGVADPAFVPVQTKPLTAFHPRQARALDDVMVHALSARRAPRPRHLYAATFGSGVILYLPRSHVLTLFQVFTFNERGRSLLVDPDVVMEEWNGGRRTSAPHGWSIGSRRPSGTWFACHAMKPWRASRAST